MRPQPDEDLILRVSHEIVERAIEEMFDRYEYLDGLGT
jgi:hypothetical protein